MVDKVFRSLLVVFALLAATLVGLWATREPDPAGKMIAPDPHAPRPIDAADTVFTEDMTWMEVRDALRAGKSTIIVSAGGVEQNGPYLVTGKHNLVLRATTAAIARELGDALVAPILPFVPQGSIDPPSLHMKYPGTVSLQEATYRQVLTEICDCWRVHGFRRVLLIGDSGGNQAGLRDVEQSLNARWPSSCRAYYIAEYDDFPELVTWLEQQGIQQTPEWIHDDFATTAVLMTVDPAAVRMEQRLTAGLFRINGVELAPVAETIAWGEKIIAHRVQRTAAAFRARIAAGT